MYIVTCTWSEGMFKGRNAFSVPSAVQGLGRLRTTLESTLRDTHEGALGWIVIQWVQTSRLLLGWFLCPLAVQELLLSRPWCLCQTMLLPVSSHRTGSLVCVIHPGINPVWREPCSWHSPSQLSEQVIPLAMKANSICGACPSQSCWSQPWQSRDLAGKLPVSAGQGYSQWKGMAVSLCWASSACFRFSRVDANRGLLMKCFM